MINLIDLGVVYLEQFTYLAVFLFLTLNGTGFFPFPEEFTILISGYLLSQGLIKLKWLLPVAILGILVGDSIFYFVGKMNPHIMHKYGKYVFLSKTIINKFNSFFKKHGKKAVFFSRFMLGFRMSASFVAGSRGMKYSTYVLLNLAGALIWAPALIFVGYAFGTYIDQIIEGIRQVKHAAFIIFLVLAGIWMAYHYFKHLLNPKRKKF